MFYSYRVYKDGRFMGLVTGAVSQDESIKIVQDFDLSGRPGWWSTVEIVP